MKNGLPVILSFLILPFSFGQKLKQKAVEINYFKAPLTPIDGFVYDYDFLVEETNMDIKGAMTTLQVYSGSNAYDTRSAFYLGFDGLSHIPGLTVKEYKQGVDEKINHIYLKVGVIDVAAREVAQNGSLQNSVLPALCYKMQLSVSIELRLSDSSRKEFYYRTTADQNAAITYKFPEDYKPTSSLKGYGTTDELEEAFQTHRAGFLNDVRNEVVKKWLYDTKLEILSLFVPHHSDFNIGIYYTKDKKGDYARPATLIRRMDTLFARINYDVKTNGSLVHWHAYEEQFGSIAQDWDMLLSPDDPAPGLSTEASEAFFKNMLWCLFFAHNIETALNLAKEKKANLAAGTGTSADAELDEFIAFAEDYKKRYPALLSIIKA